MKKYLLVLDNPPRLIETETHIDEYPLLDDSSIVIAGLENLPKIVFQEDIDTITIYPEQLAKQNGFDWKNTESSARNVFTQWSSQILNSDKKFTLEDIKKAIVNFASSAGSIDGEVDVSSPASSYLWLKDYLQKLDRPKIYEVEIEQMLQLRWGTDWIDLPNQKEGRELDGIYRRVPYIKSNRIKILKVLHTY